MFLRSKRTISAVLMIFSGLMLLNCSNYNNSEELIKGVKIYDYSGDYDELFKKWNDIGINTVFTGISLDSNKIFRSKAKENNIKRFVIVPIFFNPEFLKDNPDYYALTLQGEKAKDDWVEFVCPSRKDYRKKRIEYIKNLIEEHDPDGLSIDFIRFFVYWEMVFPDTKFASIPMTCFCENCVERFQKESGINIPDDLEKPESIFKWIKNNSFSEWSNWKCTIITSMVEDIVRAVKEIKPEILINIHAVPWRQSDFGSAVKVVTGQDLKALAEHTDYISPMCYHHMVKRSSLWISSVVEDMFNRSKSKILPSIQVSKAYLDKKLAEEDFQKAVDSALKSPSKGVVFWNWKSLEENEEKCEIVKNAG